LRNHIIVCGAARSAGTSRIPSSQRRKNSS
jgi:hypothetical protein